jgi:hypothetical protein
MAKLYLRILRPNWSALLPDPEVSGPCVPPVQSTEDSPHDHRGDGQENGTRLCQSTDVAVTQRTQGYGERVARGATFGVTGGVTVASENDGRDASGQHRAAKANIESLRDLRGRQREKKMAVVGFQDHRHRPLGHLSALAIHVYSATCRLLDLTTTSPNCDGSGAVYSALRSQRTASRYSRNG